MTNSDLAERVKDLLARQVGFYERLLVQHKPLTEDIRDEDLAGLLEQQRLDEAEFSALARELDTLGPEYEAATDLRDKDRAAIRRLADRVRELTRQLGELNQAAGHALGERIAHARNALDELARGRHMLDKYRPFRDDRDDGAFVDRKA